MTSLPRTLVVVVASLIASTPALADPTTDKATAKKLYDEGLRRYNVAEYPEAIRAWKEAYVISKRPLLLFNIAQAYRLSGDCTQAMSFYDSYRREESNLKNQSELEDAEALCKATLAEKPVAIAPPTSPPTTTNPEVTPPVAMPERAPEAPSGGGMRTAGIVVGVVGLALTGGAVFFALDAGKKADELDGYRGEWDAAHQQLEDDGKRSQMLGWTLGITGIAAIGAGVAMIALGGSSSETTGVAIAPTRGGAQVSWSLSF